jgi:hypothetical protein
MAPHEPHFSSSRTVSGSTTRPQTVHNALTCCAGSNHGEISLNRGTNERRSNDRGVVAARDRVTVGTGFRNPQPSDRSLLFQVESAVLDQHFRSELGPPVLADTRISQAVNRRRRGYGWDGVPPSLGAAAR